MENKIQQIELINKTQADKHKKSRKIKVDFFQLLSQQQINQEKNTEKVSKKYNQKQTDFSSDNTKKNLSKKNNNNHIQTDIHLITAENSQVINRSKTLAENKISSTENYKGIQSNKDKIDIERNSKSNNSKIQHIFEDLKPNSSSGENIKKADTNGIDIKVSEINDNQKSIQETILRLRQNLSEEKQKSIKGNFATSDYNKISENIAFSGDRLKNSITNQEKNEIPKISEVKKEEKHDFSGHTKNKLTENKVLNGSYRDFSRVSSERTDKDSEQQNLSIVYPMFEFDKTIDKRVEKHPEPIQKANINIDQPSQITENVVSNLEDTDFRQDNFNDTNNQQYSYNSINSSNENNEQTGKFTISVNFMDTKINIQTISNNIVMYINTQQILTQSVIDGIQKILSETGYNNHSVIVRDKSKTTKVYISNTQSVQNRKNEGLSILA